MRRILAVTGALLLAAASLSAQTYQGGVRGVVKDSGGVVPGVDVTLTNTDTNAVRTAQTNSVGEYVFANVLPGTYSLKVTLSGFKPIERNAVRIGTQQNVVLDFTLEVGALTDEVTVTGQAPLVDRADATVASSLDKAVLETTPSFGRNAFYLAIVTPNVVQSGDPQFVRLQDQTNASMLSLGGGPRRGNNYLLEGIPITDFLNRPSIFPSMESVDEVKVQVKSYDADMGRTAGGVFNTTAKSGSNQIHGSALLINKPEWATGQLYFAKKQGVAKPPQYYYDWGGSVGGPVVKDKTFFWFSTEGYKQKGTRNQVGTLPTTAMSNGDFSGLKDASGNPVTIYDPLTTKPDPNNPGSFIRTAFPNNIIPADRINQVAKSALAPIMQLLNGASETYNGNASLIDGPQNQFTIKVDNRTTEKVTTTGMFVRQHTREPGSAFYGDFFSIPGDPGASLLLRTIYFGSLNNIWVPNNTTVVAFRYGYNRFDDSGSNYPGYSAGSLGLPANYVNSLNYDTFPQMFVTGFGNGTAGGAMVGNTGPNHAIYQSHAANASMSKFVGHHTLKLGGDFRRMMAEVTAYGASAGAFTFTKDYTQGPNPNSASSRSGDAFASYLLGYPSSGSAAVAQTGNYFFNYYAGYAQDDFRATSKLTMNFGLRYEYEQGLQEANNNFTVGFDRNAAFPTQIPGMNLKGGLMYAGQNGYPTHQGNPLNHMFAPRVGGVYSVSDKIVIRGGYGLFWAPTAFPAPSENTLGARGYTATTTFLASTDGGLTPANTLSNPFPNGIQQPTGNSLGLATGAGGDVHFIDQNSMNGYVNQYSVDVQRELRGGMMVSVGYMGSRSERLSIGNITDAFININQLDPSYLSLGSQLQTKVANPFYGNAAFGNLSVSPTINYGQLLRPFPEYGNVFAHRVNAASARYNALVLRWTRRLQDGWSADVNYAYSRTTDNQFGEANFYSNRVASPENDYNLGNEYGTSLFDSPHRFNFNVGYELPFGQGKRWANSGAANMIIGGWRVTGVGRYSSGFPVAITMSSNNSGLFGNVQRPNLVPGVDPVTSGSTEDRLSQWINPLAYSAPAQFTLGNAPRTDDRVRTPMQKNIDMAFEKTFPIGDTKRLIIRMDVLNIFDDPLFLGPVTTLGTSNFGQITGVGGFGRSMQWMAKVAW